MLKTRSRFPRLLALILAAGLLLPLLGPFTALAANDAVISIRSADDLVQLSQSCTLNTWSQGKTVSLDADVDLAGVVFSPIPTFGGTFEGNGHTISGLSLDSGDSYQGLFRYIQKGAVVRSLCVTGSVTASGAQTCLGGIAGSNAGAILSCTFYGSVRGKSQVGGVAGSNEGTGVIYGCTAGGIVTGEKSTGGITGQNSGAVSGCVNKSSVNTARPEQEQSLEETVSDLTRESVLNTTTDTGGIAGLSSGVLRSCLNQGHVGYPHVGYNVGGVVGRSSGYLESCTNTGAVEGRKDVGGVAGQIAPNICLIFSPDTVSQLQDELSRLNGMVDSALNHADASRGTLSRRLEQLSLYTQSASDNASALSGTLGDWADGNISVVNDASVILADTLNRLAVVTAEGEGVLDVLADGLDGLEGSLNQIAAAMGTTANGMDDVSDSVARFRTGLSQARAGVDGIRKALDALAAALVVEDPDAIAQALKALNGGVMQLSAALTQCGSAMEQLVQLLQSPGESGAQAAVLQCLLSLANGLRSASDAVSQIGSGIADAVSAVSVDWDAVRQSGQKLSEALEHFSSSADTLDSSLKSLREALSQLGETSDDWKPALSALASTMDIFESGARDFDALMEDVRELLVDLARRDPIEFDRLGDSFHQAEEGLHSAVSGIGRQMDLLREEAGASADTLSSDIRNLSDQLQAISSLILDALSDAQESDAGELWNDVSQQRIDSVTLGKARGCVNTGSASGDLNVGGIAGAMAIEYDFDPEDDIAEVGERSLNFHYETRAILQSCVNRGSVTAKKDAAGGIAGRMDLGYVLGCESYGTVQSADGDYVGGIAGASRSTIRECWSKCTLAGGRYVGGIAGYGCEIYECVSLVSIEKTAGHAGSVAGDWDRDVGALSGNRFVESPLAGVDGISYSGQAEPVAYDVLMEEDRLPHPFLSLMLTYVSDGKPLETVSFSYGEALSSHQPPAVPEREGYYGVWEEIGEDFITVDHVVEAVYTPFDTTLASDAMRDSAHAVFLIEGVFGSQTELLVRQTQQSAGAEQWTVSLSGTDTGGHTVRFTPPTGWDAFSLRLSDGGIWSNIDWQRDGSCCVFRVDNNNFTLEAVRKEPSVSLWPFGVASAVLAAALLLLRRARKGRFPKSSGKAAGR